jgi:PEP-CTERM motif-containing protein
MSTVRAEPLTLSGLSHFQLDFEGDLFHLIGNSFDLTGRTETGVFIPAVHAPTCDPCFPGDVVNLSFHTPGEVDLGTGHGTVNHLEFPSLSFRGLLQFDAAAIVFPHVPPDLTGGISIEAPFRFNGFLRAFAGGHEVFAHSLRGVGTAFEHFVSDTGAPPFGTGVEGETPYAFDEASPVPEPSRMLLVGLGALALGRIRQLERSRPGQL